MKAAYERLEKAIEKTFAPEFINRLSNIVIFDSLGNPELHKIIDLELSKLSKRLKESKIGIKVGKALKDYISDTMGKVDDETVDRVLDFTAIYLALLGGQKDEQ